MNEFEKLISNTKQLTEEEAIELAEDNFIKDMTFLDIFKFQMSQARLCMDFSKFQEATEKVLDRGVWTHEFAKAELLWDEYLGKRTSATDPISTLNEVLNDIN